ncbi:MAG: CCA tRNA nucleotidyltransferase, partial [Tissierellia bacterium]|nr:CCA tRNA nucleotidyltransferase [Tissierellia bacterium]
MFYLPKHIEQILYTLEKNGYKAYIVGGSVRDMLLNKAPKDYDIATNATPEEIEKVFSNYKKLKIGKEYGTIILVLEEGNVEITTFRKEGIYTDGRRPSWVLFSSDIKEDLSRRDFTINAMAYNHRDGLIDPYGGEEDLRKGIIRTVGDPKDRFNEDYLRILRAVRFSTQLGFFLEESTYVAAKKYSQNISNISMERITHEFFKIILCDKPSRGIKLLENLNLLKIILPELIPTIEFDQENPHHEKDVYQHTLCVLDNTSSILQLRLAALFHDIGKPYTISIDEEGVGHFYGHDRLGAEMSREILTRFKCSNELIQKVYILVKEHMNHHTNFTDKGLKRLIRRVGEEEIFNLIELQKADIRCSNKDASIEHIIDREKRIKDILEKKEVYELNQLDINGRDLIHLGFKEGIIIGEILEYLLEKVIENPKLNHK